MTLKTLENKVTFCFVIFVSKVALVYRNVFFLNVQTAWLREEEQASDKNDNIIGPYVYQRINWVFFLLNVRSKPTILYSMCQNLRGIVRYIIRQVPTCNLLGYIIFVAYNEIEFINWVVSSNSHDLSMVWLCIQLGVHWYVLSTCCCSNINTKTYLRVCRYSRMLNLFCSKNKANDVFKRTFAKKREGPINAIILFLEKNRTFSRILYPF